MHGDLGARIVERGHDQILQHLAFVWDEQALVDLYALQITFAVEGQLNHPAAGRLGHLSLHLLRLLHQLPDVLHGPSSSASESSASSATSASSPPSAAKRSRTA